jgi:hypothetical protein
MNTVIPNEVEGSRCVAHRFRHGILRLRFAPLRMTLDYDPPGTTRLIR